MVVFIISFVINENVNVLCFVVDIINKVRDKDSLKYIIIFWINVICFYWGWILLLSFLLIFKNE